MLVRDPQLANDGLLIRVFRDEPARLSISENGTERLIGGRSGEAAACAFYLEHRQGPRGRSLSDIEPVIGRSLSSIDIEGTVQEIELAIEAALPREWRAPVVVAAGWGLGVVKLRSGVFQRRAGLPDELPPELEQPRVPEAARSLRRRVTMLREELIAKRLVERASAVELGDGRPPARHFPAVAVEEGGEQQLVGWKAIAALLGVSEDTARRWAESFGLPIFQPAPGFSPIAFPSRLRAWMMGGAAE
ncbi:hypothetical protein [Vulgatibacter sp.]|uniref:hypothetical protein n=1 Tax=Vulgatibacter sp. TaxID=1971226 RepID=UPI0035658996